MKKDTTKVATQYTWDLTPLYSSSRDPRIEQDMGTVEKVYAEFAAKYEHNTTYLTNDEELLKSLQDYEKLHVYAMPKPLLYFFYLRSLDSSDPYVTAQNSLISNRLTKASNLLTFFPISVGALSTSRQQALLRDKRFAHFHFLLSCIFTDYKYRLSVSEEKIVSLKHLPAHQYWVYHNHKLLNTRMVVWKKKSIPIAEAIELVAHEKTPTLRKKLAGLVYQQLKEVADFSEGEINAVYTDKKIDDELRGYSQPYEDTIRNYRNDPVVVERLREVVTQGFKIAHRFHSIKARLLKQKRLDYSDRAASVGKIKASYTFDESMSFVKKTFGSIDPRFASILDSYLKNRQIDVYPRKGKTSGAFCSGSYNNPTFILLNHVDSFRSLTTLAHELGHGFHNELSQSQGPLYSDYSTALAETASTLFEGIVTDAIYGSLSRADQIIVLHDKINEAVATIFRQIACFNFEFELHMKIRSQGFVAKEEIAALHNKHMSAYLGPIFSIPPDAGYMFVSWSHIRRFFYVYTYSYGLIISRALLRRYYQDRSFWKQIEQFLSAGGNDTPENILRKIGIDVTQPRFFQEGLKSIEEDIDKLEALL